MKQTPIKKTRKVYYLGHVPQIKLTGRWLQRLRFMEGSAFSLEAVEGIITLTSLEPKHTTRWSEDKVGAQ